MENVSFHFEMGWKGNIIAQSIKSTEKKNYLNLYLLQMTTFGKVARLMFSVVVTRLVETVEVVNCFTVLELKVEFSFICKAKSSTPSQQYLRAWIDGTLMFICTEDALRKPLTYRWWLSNTIRSSTKPINHLNRPQIELSQPPMNSDELKRAKAKKHKDREPEKRK